MLEINKIDYYIILYVANLKHEDIKDKRQSELHCKMDTYFYFDYSLVTRKTFMLYVILIFINLYMLIWDIGLLLRFWGWRSKGELLVGLKFEDEGELRERLVVGVLHFNDIIKTS